ncbi:helix-turn-helix transcriptional regulator [Cupriavidus taiwanensis]|uniref:helix-turn-helix transcriptional regulator n=1 Tax=Cupriavidus taiwanensis TaxID=164546 RepID=UPI001F00EBA5|nr:AlpA family phage regulatory protein [Cupriavidus taiwanensis]
MAPRKSCSYHPRLLDIARQCALLGDDVSTNPVPTTPGTGQLLRLSSVIARVGLSRAEIYRRIAKGEFPAGVRLGVRSRAWRLRDIETYIASLPDAA